MVRRGTTAGLPVVTGGTCVRSQDLQLLLPFTNYKASGMTRISLALGLSYRSYSGIANVEVLSCWALHNHIPCPSVCNLNEQDCYPHFAEMGPSSREVAKIMQDVWGGAQNRT